MKTVPNIGLEVSDQQVLGVITALSMLTPVEKVHKLEESRSGVPMAKQT